MKMAKIENGTVIDVAIASAPPKKGNWVELQGGFGIGDLYENGVFSKPPVNLGDLKTQIHDTIKSKVDAKMDNLKNGYAEREIQSWPVQLKEAEALLVDPSAPTPFLSNAKRDSETVEEYAAKVRANNAAWSSYAGQVVNWRAEMEDALDACTTEADYKTLLEAINNA